MTELEQSVYEMVGGDATFRQLVDAFYRRVAADEVLRPVFPEDLEPGKHWQYLFLAQFFGGPAQYIAERGHPRLRASGFLDPSVNSNGPAFGLWVALPSGGPLVELPELVGGGSARVQVIHNSADLAAAVVDVYLDNTLLLDDFAFRTASPFVDAPAGTPFAVGVAPGNSTSAADAIYTETFTLTDGETYVIVASGIVSATGYTPLTPFSLEVYDQGREVADDPANTDLLVLHGSTDAPTVDVYEAAVLNATAVNDASYADFAGYLELPTADYTVQVRTADNSTVVAAYSAPLQTLALNGEAITVLASGFLHPAQNSNGPA